jgi:Zn-dependent M28 family amino/carboxypeptidase
MKIRFFSTVALLFLFLIALLAVVMQPFAGSETHNKTLSTMPVDPAILKAHVKYLSVDTHPRSFDRHMNLEAAARYIETQFIAAGAQHSSQVVKVDGKDYRNIIVRFGPSTGQTIVVGAHYDSHCDAAESCTPGADDNASGVAGLIELARLLIKTPPKQAIELVAYTLEEPPHFRTEHMGSAWHATSIVGKKSSVKLMVSMEMIGYFSDDKGSQIYPVPGMALLYPDAGNYIGVVGKLSDFAATRKVKALMSGASSLPVQSINAPTWIPGIDFSDHLSYWNVGIPALMVTDTAFMRNKQYHLPGDTYEKLDYTRMAKVVQGVYAVVQHF